MCTRHSSDFILWAMLKATFCVLCFPIFSIQVVTFSPSKIRVNFCGWDPAARVELQRVNTYARRKTSSVSQAFVDTCPPEHRPRHHPSPASVPLCLYSSSLPTMTPMTKKSTQKARTRVLRPSSLMPTVAMEEECEAVAEVTFLFLRPSSSCQEETETPLSELSIKYSAKTFTLTHKFVAPLQLWLLHLYWLKLKFKIKMHTQDSKYCHVLCENMQWYIHRCCLYRTTVYAAM